MLILTAQTVEQRTLIFCERKRLNLWHAAKSIRDHIVSTLAISKIAVKLLKYFGPSSLTTLQVFLTRKPFNALLIKKNIKHSTIQITLISGVIVLCIVQFLAFKNEWMPILE